VFSDGTVTGYWQGDFNLIGFNTVSNSASLSFLALPNGTASLLTGGSFDLSFAGHRFAYMDFSGAVTNDGSFALAGSGMFSINNLEVLSASYQLNSSGIITGAPDLKFGDGSGKLTFPAPNLSLSAGGGLSFTKDIPLVNASLGIIGAPQIANVNFTARLQSSDGTSGSVRVLGTARIFDGTILKDTWSLGGGLTLDSSLEFEHGFLIPGPFCVRFDLAPLRAKGCGLPW
jgi:hypothetical protein